MGGKICPADVISLCEADGQIRPLRVRFLEGAVLPAAEYRPCSTPGCGFLCWGRGRAFSVPCYSRGKTVAF